MSAGVWMGLMLVSHALLFGLYRWRSARLSRQNATVASDFTSLDPCLMQFNRDLLQGAIEHLGQGLAIIDSELRLLVWNQRYSELYQLPNELLAVGTPIERIIRYNAKRGLCGEGDVNALVAKRLAHLKQGHAHRSSRLQANGRVIQVQGNPMPSGGYVMTFSDITAFRQAEDMLKQANAVLEARVVQRTKELSTSNTQLRRASYAAEQANKSKSRLLAGVSHDLMQPLNAAKLFTGSLLEAALSKPQQALAEKLDSSLNNAQEIIADLLDVSRLEAGRVEVQRQVVAIAPLFEQLRWEFQALAKQQGNSLSVVPCSLMVSSDGRLLRRILQNFLSNALRYNPKGKVLLGARRDKGMLRLEVWDNGPGIENAQQQRIFDEFYQLNQLELQGEGLGLGLAIVKGFAHLLKHPLGLRSHLGKGTVFSLSVPIASCAPSAFSLDASCVKQEGRILCIDNDPHILDGMYELLKGWGFEVRCCQDLQSMNAIVSDSWQPNLVLSDYHLDKGRTGLEALACLKAKSLAFEGVIISADRQQSLLDAISQQGFTYLPKPIRPLRLKKLCQQRLAPLATKTS